jgi:hypothetical protein
VTDRCVEVFDHYCPWVGNTIGKGNRHLFLVFLWLELYALLTSCGVAVWQTRAAVAAGIWSERLVWIVVFLVLSAFVSISVAVLAVAQASQVARNVTTNELANWHRWVWQGLRNSLRFCLSDLGSFSSSCKGVAAGCLYSGRHKGGASTQLSDRHVEVGQVSGFCLLHGQLFWHLMLFLLTLFTTACDSGQSTPPGPRT